MKRSWDKNRTSNCLIYDLWVLSPTDIRQDLTPDSGNGTSDTHLRRNLQLRPDHLKVFDEWIFMPCAEMCVCVRRCVGGYVRLYYISLAYTHTHTGNWIINCPLTDIQSVSWMCQCWQAEVFSDSGFTQILEAFTQRFLLRYLHQAGCAFSLSVCLSGHLEELSMDFNETRWAGWTWLREDQRE